MSLLVAEAHAGGIAPIMLGVGALIALIALLGVVLAFRNAWTKHR